jgi:hypothetical protein
MPQPESKLPAGTHIERTILYMANFLPPALVFLVAFRFSYIRSHIAGAIIQPPSITHYASSNTQVWLCDSSKRQNSPAMQTPHHYFSTHARDANKKEAANFTYARACACRNCTTAGEIKSE